MVHINYCKHMTQNLITCFVLVSSMTVSTCWRPFSLNRRFPITAINCATWLIAPNKIKSKFFNQKLTKLCAHTRIEPPFDNRYRLFTNSSTCGRGERECHSALLSRETHVEKFIWVPDCTAIMAKLNIIRAFENQGCSLVQTTIE